MDLPSTRLYRDELVSYTDSFLGRFFRTFAALELNLSLRVEGGGSFKEKLDRFLELEIAKHGESDLRYCEVFAWYMAVDSLRDIRNRFAHGRWGFHTHSQSVVHVAGYPPEPTDERRYSLLELDLMVKDAESLSYELLKIAY